MLFSKGSVGSSPTFGTKKKTPDILGGFLYSVTCVGKPALPR